MAAATMSQGCSVARKTRAETTMSPAWAIRTARAPYRSAGRRMARVIAALASNVRVTATPIWPAPIPCSAR